MIITDFVFAVVECAMEVGCAVAGVDGEEKAAIDAAMAGVAAGCGAAAVATANAVQVAVTVANKVMDEAGVAADSPLRKAVETSLQAAGTVCSGGASTASLVSAGVQVAMDGAAMGMQEAGVEGGQALGALSGAVAGGSSGNINWSETGIRAGSAIVGGGIAACCAAGGDDKDVMAAMGTGAQMGMSVGGLGSSLGTGLSTPASSTPAADGGGGQDVPAAANADAAPADGPQTASTEGPPEAGPEVQNTEGVQDAGELNPTTDGQQDVLTDGTASSLVEPVVQSVPGGEAMMSVVEPGQPLQSTPQTAKMNQPGTAPQVPTTPGEVMTMAAMPPGAHARMTSTNASASQTAGPVDQPAAADGTPPEATRTSNGAPVEADSAPKHGEATATNDADAAASKDAGAEGSKGDSTTEADTDKPLTREQALAQARDQGINLAAGVAVGVAAHKMADDEGDADFNRSAQLGLSTNVTSLRGMGTKEGWTTKKGVKNTANASLRLAKQANSFHQYTQNESKAKWYEDDPQMSSMYSGRAQKANRAFNNGYAPLGEVLRAEDDPNRATRRISPIWEWFDDDDDDKVA